MDIDVVIIGLNAAHTLGACIESVRAAHYTRGRIRTWFVDSGSGDGSPELAATYPGVKVARLDARHPSPGAARNTGWRLGRAPVVQFLDADTRVDPRWFDRAVDALQADPEVAAVRGNRREIRPEASLFNWIADREWNAPAGPCEAFGGDVLIRRSALEATGGYDEVLVGGEDPELSRRVRDLGAGILQLDVPMTRHDMAMYRIGQYMKRGFRTGYGYAAVVARHGRRTGDFWTYEVGRILVRGGLAPALGLFGALAGLLVHPAGFLALLPALLLLLYPSLFSQAAFRRELRLNPAEARRYALHCSLVVLPEFLGDFLRGHVLRIDKKEGPGDQGWQKISRQ